MIPRAIRKAALVAGMSLAALTPMARAQSSDALMDALVRKGILTDQEAKQIKADLAKENKASNNLTVGSKEVTNMRLYGDVRGRFESFSSDNDAFVDRTRFRYRLRAGMTATLKDQFEVGFRITSSEANGNFGGDPISSNTTLSNNGSKKFVFIDLAYGSWTPIKNQDWSMTLTVGKMENPFVFSDMVFDQDYTPEGAGQNVVWNINDKHKLGFNFGEFVLDEFGGDSNDPFMLGAQARFDSTWSPKISTSFGASILGITAADTLVNGAVPNSNGGNTRLANGAPAASFSPIILDASVTYHFAKAPIYSGAFPVRLAVDYMSNTSVSDRNEGYSAGVSFGKAGRKGNWELAYRYKYLEGDAWWEEFVDSDFGGYYQAGAPGSGSGAGYNSGTNVKGHIFRLAYSPFNSTTLSVTYFLTDLIDELPAGSNSDMGRLQVDASWRF